MKKVNGAKHEIQGSAHRQDRQDCTAYKLESIASACIEPLMAAMKAHAKADRSTKRAWAASLEYMQVAGQKGTSLKKVNKALKKAAARVEKQAIHVDAYNNAIAYCRTHIEIHFDLKDIFDEQAETNIKRGQADEQG